MRDFNSNFKSKQDRKNRVILIILFTFAVAFIGYILYKNFSIPSDKILTPESYYLGSKRELSDPKTYYYSLHGLSLDTEDDTNVCNPKRETGTEIKIHNNSSNSFAYYTDLDGDIPTNDATWMSLIGEDGSGTFKDNYKIYCPIPVVCHFKNSNVSPHAFPDDTNLADTQIDIAIYKGDESEVLVVFENVRCWYCHTNYKGSQPQHNIIIGSESDDNKSINNSCMILGEATSNTKVKVYKVKDNVLSEGKYAKDVKSIDDVYQIKASNYFVNDGEVVPV